MTVLDFPATDRRPGLNPTVATVRLHEDLWRVTRPDGEVLGYVERAETPAGQRYTAKRMLQRQRRFLPVGEFWSIDDALDCFRF